MNKKHKLTALIVAISLILVIAAIAFGVYFGLKKSNQIIIVLDYGESSGSTVSVTVSGDEKIYNLPAGLTVADKYYLEFAGWYTERNCGGIKVADERGVSEFTVNSGLAEYVSKNTLRLYAGFRNKKYEVNFFNTDGSKLIQSDKYEYGTSFNEFTGKVNYDNMVVMSWAKEYGGGIFTGRIEGDTNLFALTFGVHIYYDTDGGNELQHSIVTVGETFSLPIPVKDYNRFIGWYRNNQYVGEFIIVPNSDVTLVAHWEKTHYSVTFDSDGGSEAEDKMVKIGESVTLPAVTKSGYTLDGWYDLLNKKHEGNFIPERDTELFAKWLPNNYTITLDAQGGVLNSTIHTVTYGEPYLLPVPQFSGYSFEGWYSQSTNGIKKTLREGNSLAAYDEADNTIFYAQWKELETFTVSFNRQSCKQDNGYNPSQQGTEKDVLAHSVFELIELNVNSCVKDSNGAYHIPPGEKLNLSVNVLKDINSLPTGSHLGSPNWTVHYLSNDNYNGAVYGTNIRLQNIGCGAYYIKVTYDDGTFTESNKVNFLNKAKQNDIVNLNIDTDTSKVISEVEVVCVYEIYYDYMTNIWDWNGTKCFSNWRCSVTLKFN